jgi:hypothetical protein
MATDTVAQASVRVQPAQAPVAGTASTRIAVVGEHMRVGRPPTVLAIIVVIAFAQTPFQPFIATAMDSKRASYRVDLNVIRLPQTFRMKSIPLAVAVASGALIALFARTPLTQFTVVHPLVLFGLGLLVGWAGVRAP